VKQHLLQVARRLHLLASADRLHYLGHRMRSSVANRRFVAEYPEYALPPAALAFEAYGHTSWQDYRATGQAHAAAMVALIREQAAPGRLRIAEWGCGCGRILRHIAPAGLRDAELSGFDVDQQAIDWCRTHLAGIAFWRCEALPPLPAADGRFDVVYHYSVWTHLSESSVRAWSTDLARVLAPGGILIATTHGDRYRHMLLPDERSRYDAGQPVSRAGYREGRKYYLSFHPPSHVEATLRQDFRRVLRVPAQPALPQDVWIAFK